MPIDPINDPMKEHGLLGPVRSALARVLRTDAASGLLLVAAALVALLWANSPWADGYAHVWHSPISVRIGAWTIERSLAWVVEDVLMVLFFFVVGLEIRLEIHGGEMSEWRRAALPAAAALGGMLAPAALYLAIAGGGALRSGWGIPMATDIAFALGILALLGKRVPAGLRLLLLALAVIDDLGAIVVIAVFYSEGIELSGLLWAALGLGGIWGLRCLRVRARLAYIPPAVVVWAGIYGAGIHPTIAGVMLGLLTPVRAELGPRDIARREAAPPAEAASPAEATSPAEAVSPAAELLEALQPWVAFGVMPIFALASAGVSVSGVALDTATTRVVTAISVGLVIGKPLGVVCASWLVLRLRIGTLPERLSLRHLWMLGAVAGVGFTMALFIARLAFTDATSLGAAKLGVLVASSVAAVFSLILGRLLLAPTSAADEAVDG